MPMRKNRRQSLERPAPTNQEKRSPEKHSIQASLCGHLKTVYFSKDEGTIKRSIENMGELFEKVYSNRVNNKAFFDELKFRMNFLIDNKQSQTCRVRCLRAIAMLAVRLFKKGKPGVLNFCVEYCKQLSNAESTTLRQYICILIQFLYKSCKSSNPYNASLSVLLPQEAYRQLFSILKDRWLDIFPIVRKETIRCLAFIQDDEVSADHEDAMIKSPKEMLMTSLGDGASDCREEAIKALTMTDPTQTKLILTRVLIEPDWQVKKEALTKILSIQDTQEISSRERMDILEHLFGPSQHYLSEMAYELLLNWVTLAAGLKADEQVAEDKEDKYTLFAGTFFFAKQLDPIKKEELCEKAVILAMQNLANEHRGFTDFVHTLTASPASNIVHRNNYKELLNQEVPLLEKAYSLFYWRCMLELCSLEYEHKQDQKSICMYKLIPTLQAYAEFANEFVQSFGYSSVTLPMSVRGNKRKTKEEQRRFCLVQLFRIFHFLDEEPVGMKSWKELLFHVLSNTKIQLYPELVQEIVESIVHVHFAQGEDVEAQALHEFCDVISMFVQKTSSPNCTQAFINQTISISQSEETEPQPIALKLDDEARGRSLIVLNAFLRTGKLSTITAELQGLHDTILPDSFGSHSPEERSLALECLGVICLMDETWAEHNTSIIKQFITLDLTMVKLTCLSILSELIVKYGHSRVNLWYQNNKKRRSSRNSLLASSMINTIIEFTLSNEPELAFRATECLCKCCLHANEVNEWRKVLLNLLLLSFKPESKDNPKNGKQKACFSRFMPIFAAISRKNQVLLAEVLFDALDNLKERDLQSSLTSISETALSSYIINLTSLNILGSNAPDRQKGSAHSHLATLVLTALKNNADNYFASVYCKILSDLELNENMTIDDFNNLLFLCTDVCNENTTEKAKDIKHIQQFLKRLTYLKEKMGAVPAARSESVASSLDELRLAPTTPLQKARPLRTVSSKKKRTSLATLTNSLNAEKEESRKRIVPPTALRFRQRIDRAAKAQHRFYNTDEDIIEEDDDVELLLHE